MRIVATSDTHNNYPELPEGDVLIHCGDLTAHGSLAELDRALSWLSQQSHAHKLLVAGNHDRLLTRELASKYPLTYLEDDQFFIDRYHFYGTPWTPLHQDFAFMLPPDQLREKFSMIPAHLDVLITHGPPFRVLDYSCRPTGDYHFGSAELQDALRRIPQPRVHMFGHIHEAYGYCDDNHGHRSYNVSWVGFGFDGPQPPNPPVIINI